MSAIRVILLFSLLVASGFALFMPACKPYFLDIKSIKELRVNREYLGVGTKLYINKTSKGTYNYKVQGCLHFVQETGPLSASMAVQVKDGSSSSTSGRYNDYKNDFHNLGVVCTSPIIKPFFNLYKNKITHGNCIFDPQTICLGDGIDMDEEIHKGMDSVECGSFKIHLRYSVPDVKEPVIEWELLCEVINRSEMKISAENRNGGQKKRKENSHGKSDGKNGRGR